MITLTVKVRDLCEPIEVFEDGSFELPPQRYTSAELKRIARDVNRACKKVGNFDLEEIREDI